jgi:hypothetical protein
MPAAVPLAIAGAGLVGAGASIVSGNRAANAQQESAAAQVAESRRQYDLTRADYAPWRQTGQSALQRLAGEYGLNGQRQNSQFEESPGYEFRLQQGVQAAERSAAARGLLGSGATMKAVQRYGEGLAASEYGDYWNRLAGLAGVGQAATGATAQAGMATTGMINNAYQQSGNARASSYANTGSAINSGINNVLSAYLYHQGGGFGGAS